MNLSDDDLNALLKTWTVPRSPHSLEERLRRAYRDSVRSRARQAFLEAPADGTTMVTAMPPKRGPGAWTSWIAGFAPTVGKLAAVIAGAVILLAVITRAFPQSLAILAPPAAITLDSEFLDYNDDGSSTVTEYRTSHWTSSLPGGGETVLSRSFPGDPLRTAAWDILNPVQSILGSITQRVISPLFYRPGRAKYLSAAAAATAARIRNGCAPTNMWGRPMTVIGEETILSHTTTVSQSEIGDLRLTEWFAPGLDCVSLRSTREKGSVNGAFRMISEMRIVKITTNSHSAAAKEQTR
jgi:hypothetical protein